jgi:hypothetical protein
VGSYLHRAATTKYPCYVPILGDSEGAGRTGLPVFHKSGCKGNTFFENSQMFQQKILLFALFFVPLHPTLSSASSLTLGITQASLALHSLNRDLVTRL